MFTGNQQAAKKRKFLKSFAHTKGNVQLAAQVVKISRRTYYNWCKEDPEFAEAAEEIVEGTGDFVESKLMLQISNNITAAIIFYCKTRLKKRGYVEGLELTGKDGGAVELSDAKDSLMRGLVPEFTDSGEDTQD